MKKIESPQNSYIKQLLKLQEKSRERKKNKLFIVEGKREVELAILGGFIIDTVLFVEEVANVDLSIFSDTVDKVQISKEVYCRLAYRNTTEGLIAVVRTKDFSIKNMNLTSENPLIMVLEGVEKPGNIGAILRTADAANLDAVLIADPKTDMFNPNIVRSSVGCLFTNTIGVGSSQDIINFLQKNNINIYSATLQNSNVYYTEDYTKASAIVVGTEATGLTKQWRDHATSTINIPMEGKIDSMNVSVAAAIVAFEAKRQRSCY